MLSLSEPINGDGSGDSGNGKAGSGDGSGENWKMSQGDVALSEKALSGEEGLGSPSESAGGDGGRPGLGQRTACGVDGEGATGAVGAYETSVTRLTKMMLPQRLTVAWLAASCSLRIDIMSLRANVG